MPIHRRVTVQIPCILRAIFFGSPFDCFFAACLLHLLRECGFSSRSCNCRQLLCIHGCGQASDVGAGLLRPSPIYRPRWLVPGEYPSWSASGGSWADESAPTLVRRSLDCQQVVHTLPFIDAEDPPNVHILFVV